MRNANTPEKRTIRFRTAADEIIRSNRKIRDQIRAVKPFYIGEDVPIPPDEKRLEAILNPKRNGACNCLDDFCDALKEYRTGEYPTHILDAVRKTTLSLIRKEIEPILRVQHCNMLITIIDDLHNYLRKERSSLNIIDHINNLDKFRTNWSKCCCKVSDAFYEQTSKLLEARKAAKKKQPNKSKKTSLGKGRQTPFMKKQREVFAAYLLDHPVTPSVSILTRAHKCWLEHKKEWDKHAKDGTGYTTYKTIAQPKW